MLRFHTTYAKVKRKGNSASTLDAARIRAERLGLFRARDFVAAGFPREYLVRLVARGEVRKHGRGLYAGASFDGDHHLSLAEVAKIVPRGVVCLSSALQFHQIGTQSPHEIWIALPRGVHVPAPRDRPLRLLRFSRFSHAYGVQQHKVAGAIVRVYSPAKTVADCFKFRNRHGLDVAVEALRDGWRRRMFTAAELADAATVCRVRRVMQPYLEMLG